jgi:hypothetical protein
VTGAYSCLWNLLDSIPSLTAPLAGPKAAFRTLKTALR